jgi:putative oxidoreductase
MKTVSLIARLLLGLVFLVFGLNGFLAFIPAGPMPAGAVQFVNAMSQSHYMTVVFAVESMSGVLLLAGQFVPLALTVLAPVIVNIVLFHGFMAPQGLPIAALVAILWLLAAHQCRAIFSGLLRRQLAA